MKKEELDSCREGYINKLESDYKSLAYDLELRNKEYQNLTDEICDIMCKIKENG